MTEYEGKREGKGGRVAGDMEAPAPFIKIPKTKERKRIIRSVTSRIGEGEMEGGRGGKRDNGMRKERRSEVRVRDIGRIGYMKRAKIYTYPVIERIV